MISIGVYEKAIGRWTTWSELMGRARDAGFDFIEIAIDESEERLARLDWSNAEKSSFLHTSLGSGMPVRSMILSALRRTPLGAADPEIRAAGNALLRSGISFAAQTGIRCLQIPGYYSFYQPSGPDGAERFTEALLAASELAASAGVMLGIENMDGNDITDIPTALRHVEAVGSPWVKLYPDIGNLAANSHDVGQIALGAGQLIGVHVKDARPGEFRRVDFGTGSVQFVAAFAALARIGYSGPYVVEMWNDGAADSDARARSALHFVRGEVEAAYARGMRH